MIVDPSYFLTNIGDVTIDHLFFSRRGRPSTRAMPIPEPLDVFRALESNLPLTQLLMRQHFDFECLNVCGSRVEYSGALLHGSLVLLHLVVATSGQQVTVDAIVVCIELGRLQEG